MGGLQLRVGSDPTESGNLSSIKVIWMNTICPESLGRVI